MKRVRDDLAAVQSRLEDTQRALDISKQVTVSIATEKTSVEAKIQQHVSMNQELQLDLGAIRERLHHADKNNEQYTRELHSARERISQLEGSERELTLRLDMQLEHSREMEVRLEQALTRWKQEKSTSQKETDRCSRLRTNCSELVEKNQRLQLEMERQTEKLKLYDSLPMPEEIKARMRDLDSDLRHKTEEANDLMSAYEELQRQHNHMQEENQRLCLLIDERAEELATAASDNEHLQATIDHLHAKTADLSHSAVLERNNSMSMLDEERKTIAQLRQELEDTKESQRQDRVALAHALKAKKKAQIGGSMSRMGSIRSFEDGAASTDAFESPINSPNGKQMQPIGEQSNQEGDLEDPFTEQQPAEGEYTRDPDVRAKAQINIAIEKQDMAGILKLIQVNTKNENFSWRGARALREMFIHSEEKKAECIALKADDVLISALDMFPAAAMVQAQCLRALAALSFGNDMVRRQSGERGIFKKIVTAIDNHMGDENVLLHALTTVTNLTHNSIDNRFR